jgi:hypothetical protein
MSIRSVHSARAVRTNRSAYEFIRLRRVRRGLHRLQCQSGNRRGLTVTVITRRNRHYGDGSYGLPSRAGKTVLL